MDKRCVWQLPLHCPWFLVIAFLTMHLVVDVRLYPLSCLARCSLHLLMHSLFPLVRCFSLVDVHLVALVLVNAQRVTLVICFSLVDALACAALELPCRCACRLALSMVE